MIVDVFSSLAHKYALNDYMLGLQCTKEILWYALYLFALLILSDAFNHLEAEFDNCICN